jgi:hypothetical protein
VKRREFITVLGGAAAWPVAARAQQADRMRRIGVLMAHPAGDLEFQAYLAAFQEGLQKLGWTEGRNIRIDSRWGAPDDHSKLPLPPWQWRRWQHLFTTGPSSSPSLPHRHASRMGA